VVVVILDIVARKSLVEHIFEQRLERGQTINYKA
jgi:hypothetical protein